jgi:hypothetical protein
VRVRRDEAQRYIGKVGHPIEATRIVQSVGGKPMATSGGRERGYAFGIHFSRGSNTYVGSWQIDGRSHASAPVEMQASVPEHRSVLLMVVLEPSSQNWKHLTTRTAMTHIQSSTSGVSLQVRKERVVRDNSMRAVREVPAGRF